MTYIKAAAVKQTLYCILSRDSSYLNDLSTNLIYNYGTCQYAATLA